MDPGVEKSTNEKDRKPRCRYEHNGEQCADVQRRIVIDPIKHGRLSEFALELKYSSHIMLLQEFRARITGPVRPFPPLRLTISDNIGQFSDNPDSSTELFL